jgi:predicted DNA binding CopG/RHH family protein
MSVDFFFIGNDFSQYYIVFPVTDKARQHFGVGAEVASIHVSKSDINELLNRAEREGLTYQDIASKG